MNKQMLKYFRKNFSNISQRRVVVTGMGMVSSLGVNYKESWDNMINHKSGIIDISGASNIPVNCKIAAPISKTFNPKNYKTLVSK